MYFLKAGEVQHKYLDELARAFPNQFRPELDDYTRKMLITISQAEAPVIMEVVGSPPRLPVEIRIDVSVLIDGHEVESSEKKLLVHSIVAELVTAINIISPRDKKFIAFHSTQH
jgi:hypothetical protein